MLSTISLISLLTSVVAGTLVATDASAKFPLVKEMGASIEGVSVDAHGNILCVNSTHVVNLSKNVVLFSEIVAPGTDAAATPFFASSRVLKTGEVIFGDAARKKVFSLRSSTCKPPQPPQVKFATDTFLQPNDMAVSGNFNRFYFSGQNFSAGTGDLHFAAANEAKPTLFPIDIGRANGIELSVDDKTLFITGARTVEGVTNVAKVFKVKLDDKGVPVPNVPLDVAIDLFAAAKSDGSMDPDGMRIDIEGTMYSTLNAFKSILVWSTADPTKFEKVALATVKFPSNLEMGGPDGKTLVVVGRCDDGTTACVDEIKVPHAGKAFTKLQKAAGGYRRLRN